MLFAGDDGIDWEQLRGSSCAFGVFDGLHRGHRFLIDQAKATAVGEDGGRAVILTFDIDPDEVFHPTRLKKIMSNADRIAALGRVGADAVVVLPFIPALYTLGPVEFLDAAFPAGAPEHLHVGNDFRFGAAAAGSVETLRAWGACAKCSVHAHGLVSAVGAPITATRIRMLLASCQVEEAAHLLGHPYTVHGTVERGRGEGTSFGFATANLHVAPLERVLGEGVYAAWARIGGERYRAAVSVGVSPTFADRTDADVEAHILDFTGDLVGHDIALDFAAYLRPLVKFASTDELIATVGENIAWIRANL